MYCVHGLCYLLETEKRPEGVTKYNKHAFAQALIGSAVAVGPAPRTVVASTLKVVCGASLGTPTTLRMFFGSDFSGKTVGVANAALVDEGISTSNAFIVTLADVVVDNAAAAIEVAEADDSPETLDVPEADDGAASLAVADTDADTSGSLPSPACSELSRSSSALICMRSSVTPRSSGDDPPGPSDCASGASRAARVGAGIGIDASDVVGASVPVLLEKSRKLSQGTDTFESTSSDAAAMTTADAVGRAGAGVMSDAADNVVESVGSVVVEAIAPLASTLTPAATDVGTTSGTPSPRRFLPPPSTSPTDGLSGSTPAETRPGAATSKPKPELLMPTPPRLRVRSVTPSRKGRPRAAR